jgi:DNA processing protein
LSSATVVVEAAWRSGALITAREAVELGRPVGAVPGPVTSAASAGCHRLLRDGAVCVTDAAEVAELIDPLGQTAEERTAPDRDHDGLDPVDLRVLDALPVRRSAAVESVAIASGVDLGTVRAALGRLELRDLARPDAGRWRRATPSGREAR